MDKRSVNFRKDSSKQVDTKKYLQDLVYERTRALAVANAQLEERVGEFNILYQIMKSATRSVQLNEILDHIIKAINQTIEPDSVAILLIERETNELVIHAHAGFDEESLLVRRALGTGVAGIVAQTGETIIIPDVRLYDIFHGCNPNTLSEICVPLKIGKKILGALNLESNKLNAFSESDIRPLSIIASNLAIIIQNSQLYEDTRRLKEFNENIIQSISEAIVFEDTDGYFTFVNPAAEKLFGYHEDELVGKHWTEVFPKYLHRRIKEEIAKNDIRHYESEIITKDQRTIPIIISARSLYRQGKFNGILATLINISERVLVEEKLRTYAMTDMLTGIYNRRYFFQIAPGEIERAQRYNHPLSLILFDVDHFKKVNDTYGHGIGDQVLKILCDQCAKNLRENDIFARHGGEEFVILLPETKKRHALLIAERIRKDIAMLKFPANDSNFSITISIGVASLRVSSPLTLDNLLLYADKALYIAKGQGRNRVAAWRGDNTIPNRLKIIKDKISQRGSGKQKS